MIKLTKKLNTLLMESACVLGHKNIKNTQIYMHLADFKGEEYHSEVARTIDEARKLIESGFSFVCDIGGAKLFSMRN